MFETLVDAYYNKERSAAFLETLLREIPERIVVVWDGGNMHKGDPIREVVERFQSPIELGEIAALRTDPQSDRTAVELVEIQSPVQCRSRQCDRAR